MSWSESTFAEIADFKNGLNFLSSDRGFSIKVVGVGDFQDRIELGRVSDLATIEVSAPLRADEYLQEGDLLFVRSNGNKKLIGRCLRVGKLDQPVSFSGFTIRARLKSDKCLSEFAKYLLNSKTVKKQFLIEGGGTNISNLSQEILARLRILIPPISEQRRITEILHCWDKAVSQAENNISAKQRHKFAVIQNLYSRFSKEGEWSKVSDFLAERDERGVKSEDLPLYSLTIEEGVTPKSDRYDREKLVKDKGGKKYKVVYPHDIVFNPANLRWGAIGLSKENRKVLVSPIYEVLYCKDPSLTDFIFQFLSSPRQIALFATMTEGTLIERMSVKVEAFLECDIPISKDMDECRMVGSILKTLDEEIHLLTQLKFRLKKQKQAIMEKLLTGEMGVKECL